MSNLEITKQVPLSKQLLSAAEDRINELGIKFPEYIRHLILADTKMISNNIVYLTREQEREIDEAFKDVQEGRVTELKSDKDVDNHFKNIMDRKE
jgi:hypothetical protein